MQIDTDILHNEDCLNGLRKLPNECVDLVVTDPPYHIVGGGCSKVDDDNEPSGIFNRRRCKAGEYDGNTKHINLSGMLGGNNSKTIENARSGKLFDHNDIEFSEWLPEVFRVLKQNTHCYIMVNARNLKDLQAEAEKVGFQFQQLLVWKKNNCTPNRYYLNQLEFILMLRKGAARDINDMGMSNCLSIPNIIGKGEKNAHPTAKPVALMEVLIKQSSKEGDIVLEPFAGGGSTLLAAKHTNRHYIGYEIDKKYYDMSIKALDNDMQQLELF